MLSRGHRDPSAIASILQSNPGAHLEILTLLHQTLGNGFVHSVLEIVAPSLAAALDPVGASGSMRVTASGLHVRSTPNKTTEDNIVSTLRHDATIEGVGQHGEWIKFEHKGKPAFAHGRYLEPVAPPKPSDTPAAMPTLPTAATAPAELAPAPAPAPATPVVAAPPTPVVAPDPVHVAKPTTADAEPQRNKKPTNEKATRFTKYGGGTVKAVLTRLANEGRLKITGNQIAHLDAVAQVETGGQVGGVDTTDDEVVSIGFHQVVLASKSIEAVMKKAPAAFAKHGLALDLSKTYDVKSNPHQIVGVPDFEDLRTREWGMKFYDSSLEPEVIIAIVEFALEEAKLVEKITADSGGTTDFFNDDSAKAWLLEVHNNRPAFTGPSVKRAIDDGAKSAKTRDQFLDILSNAIVETYGVMEPLVHYKKAKAKAKKKHAQLTAEQDTALRDQMTATYTAKGRKKGTNIVTKMSRHLEIPKLGAPAAAKAAPVVAHHEAPAHADEHHAPAPAPAPTPVAHHDAPTPTPAAPTPVAHHDAPAQEPVAHHDPEPAPKVAPTPAVTPAAPTNVSQAPAHAEGKSIMRVLKLDDNLPTVHAYVPPGGVQESVEVFLFLHGMFAYHDRSEAKKQNPRTLNDPRPEEAMGMATAMAQTTRNLVTLAPVAHFAGEWPLWNKLAKERGFEQLIVQSLAKLSDQLKATPPLNVGSISIAGHSAGGQGLGEAALQLGDAIHDMTFQDAGYKNKGSNAWEESHQKVAEWLLSGETDKRLRVLLHGENNKREGHVLHSQLNEESLEKTAEKLKKVGVTVTREEGNHDARTVDKQTYLHHRLHVHGLKGTRVVSVFNMPRSNHMDVRNKTTKHLITEDRDTEFERDAPQGAGSLESKPAPAPAPAPVPQVVEAKAAPDVEEQAPAAPQADAAPAKKKPKAKKPRAAKKKTPSAYDRDNATDLDSYGNQTERGTDRAKNMGSDTHRVFTNQFTTVKKAPVLTHKFKSAKQSLEAGTILQVHKVEKSYAQIATATITLEQNLWINFKYIGGNGSTSPGLGNESTDKADKARADAISAKLPTGRNPGQSKHKWQFTGAFQPSLDGVALDGSLMTKVNALMEWAIANDMITKNIEINSGMRGPGHAHKMALRYQLAHQDGAACDFDAIRKLPDGKYRGWKFCPKPNATDAEIKKQAHQLYADHGGKGAAAAAGYPAGHALRSPLTNAKSPGVSMHCSGHAIDIDIPWRSASDPKTTDVWAWEEIYHQFGLTRPLHKDRGFTGSKAESWHIEETGKNLDETADE